MSTGYLRTGYLRVPLTIGLGTCAILLILRWFTILNFVGNTDYIEGHILHHEWQIHEGEPLYDRALMNVPPYSIPVYGPLWYHGAGALQGRRPGFFPGRFLSILASLILMAVAFWFLNHHGLAPLLAGVLSLSWMVSVGAFEFGCLGRADVPALALASIALMLHEWAMCSRSVSGEGDRRQRRDIFSTVLLPVPFLLLAGFTKPTAAVSTSLVLAIHLAWCDSFRSALSFVAVLFAGVVFTLLVGDRLTDGAMSASLIYANMNEFLPSNAPRLLTSYSANWIGPLSWLVGIGALAQKEGGPRLVGLMVVVSGGIALIGSCKVGSNVGYFIEPSWAGAVASGIVVRKLGPDRWRAGVCVALLLIALLQSVAMCSDRLIRDRIEEESWPETYRVVSRYGQLGPILTLEVGSQLLSGQKPFVPDLFIANRLATEGKLDISALVKGIADHEYVAVLAGEELWPGADGASFWNQELAVTILTHYRPVLTQRHFRVFVPRINPFVPPGGWVVEGRLGRHPMREEVRGTDPRRPELRVTRLFDETSTRVLHEIPQQGSVPHGTVRSWFPDGTLAYELVFDQGVPVGEERTWHPNGQLWTITLYANGRLEGKDRRFSPDGSPLPGVLWTDGWPSLESR